MKHSAGIIPFRKRNGKYEFFVGHPGGPYWERKNYWALFKGGIQRNETEMEAAIREFREETGFPLPKETEEKLVKVMTVQQNPHKKVTAFAVEYGDINPEKCFSNMADGCVWPEIDRYEWKEYDELIKCTNRSNIPFYEEIVKMDKEEKFN